jgi:hypothetical protein
VEKGKEKLAVDIWRSAISRKPPQVEATSSHVQDKNHSRFKKA